MKLEKILIKMKIDMGAHRFTGSSCAGVSMVGFGGEKPA